MRLRDSGRSRNPAVITRLRPPLARETFALVYRTIAGAKTDAISISASRPRRVRAREKKKRKENWSRERWKATPQRDLHSPNEFSLVKLPSLRLFSFNAEM